MYNPITDYAHFSPSKMKIVVDWKRLAYDYPKTWKIQGIALLVHELVHLYEWVILCRFDVDKWNDFPYPEQRANKVQDMVLHLFGIV